MTTPIRTALALMVVAAVTALYLVGFGRSSNSPIESQDPKPSQTVTTSEIAPIEVPVATRVEVKMPEPEMEPAKAPEPTKAETPNPEPTGLLVFTLTDAREEFLIGHIVQFVRVSSDTLPELSRKAVTDKYGQSFIDAMPVGKWTARHLGVAKDSALNESGVVLGEFEIAEGRPTYFKGTVLSDRVLEGAVALAGHPDAAIKVQLFALWEPGKPIAEGWSYAVSDQDRAKIEKMPPEKRKQYPEFGAFKFTGLVPSIYKLRFIASQTSDGRPLYVEHEVDLLEENKKLSPEEITVQQLLAALSNGKR